MEKDKSKAMTSFILGLFFLVPLFNVILAIIGLIFGIIALREINQKPELYDGKTYAIIGVVLCSIVLLASAIGGIYLLFSGGT